MNRRWFLAGLVALLVAGVSAEARMHSPYRGHRIIPANAAPLDGFTSPSGAYSFRKLISTYAGPAVKLQRVDTTTQDIGFTAAGDFDKAAAATFCTTACTVNTRYDQSGNGRHLTQVTSANQPLYVPNCNGALPCMQETASTVQLLGATFTPATGVASFSAVAMKTGTTGFCAWFRENGGTGNRISSANAAPNATVIGGTSGSIVAAAADNAWHSLQGVINGAASVLNVDGVETTGTATGSVTAVTPGITATVVAPNICNSAEEIFWDAYTLTGAERTALTNNQRNYWMPAPLDSFTQPSGAYSFRKLRSTYAGPAIRIRRASDNAELDINFLGCTGFTGCPWDGAAANAHCAATSCFVVTIYDQSGNVRHLTNATPGQQPTLVFNCDGSLPCMRFLAATFILQSVASITPATGLVTLNVVGNRSSGNSAACQFFRENGGSSNRITATASPNVWALQPGFTAAATDAVWHSATGVMNTTSSVLNIDGVETTGMATPVMTAGQLSASGALAMTCDTAEIMVWDNYVMPLGERNFLTANQRSYGLIP